MTTTSAVAGSVTCRSRSSVATRSPRRIGRSGGRLVVGAPLTASGPAASARTAAERLQAVLALARPGQGAGPPLDELRVAVAGRDLRTDLVSVDVFAEADEGTAGCRPLGAACAPTTRLPTPRPTASAPSYRPAASSTGTRTPSRRSTAAPAARTRSRFGVRSPMTTRSTSIRWGLPSSPTTTRPGRHFVVRGPGASDGGRDAARRSRPRRREAPRRRRRGRQPRRRAAPARPGSTPMARDEIDRPARAHHARAIGAADRRDPLVRAGRGDDRSGADRPQRRVVDRGHDALVPADGRRAVEEPDVGVARVARDPGTASTQRDADAACRGLVRRGDARSAAAHDEHVDLEVDAPRATAAAEGRATGSRPRPPNPRITSR